MKAYCAKAKKLRVRVYVPFHSLTLLSRHFDKVGNNILTIDSLSFILDLLIYISRTIGIFLLFGRADPPPPSPVSNF